MVADIVVLSLVALILGAVGFYILRQKKKGVKCIGCPAGKLPAGYPAAAETAPAAGAAPPGNKNIACRGKACVLKEGF